MERKYGAFTSVDNPEKLAASIEGVLVLFSALFGGWLSTKGIKLLPNEIQVFSLNLAVGISAIVSVIGVIRSTFGVLRKGTQKLGQVFSK